jgi:Kef-type K+ transport system membrane component KefB
VFGDVFRETQREATLGATIDDAEWTKVVNSVDVDLALLLVSVVTVVPLCKAIDVSPVLGFLGVGLLLNQQGLFSENQEVDQFCELGIQFLLFEMGLELSVQRLKALGKYAFGLGWPMVLFVNILFASALLPPGHAFGTMVLEKIQNSNLDILQINSSLQAVVIGFALSLSSSALGLQLLADKNMLTTKLGTASLGVLLFQDLAVVPFIILLPLLQTLSMGGDGGGGGGGGMEMDYGLMAASTATSFLDLGVLSYAGYWAAVQGYKTITKLECGNDVFVALSLLVLFGFSNATSAIGFSDSLGAFLAGLVLAGTPYAHDIMSELRAFKGLFLSLFFVTIGTTIDLPLAIELFPIVLAMTFGLMVVKTGVVTALGPITGLTWRESLVAGAFLSQGGEFAFVIFGQATSGSSGSLFQQDLDELLVVVVIASMALTPLVVDLALKVAGPELNLEPCSDGDDEEACEVGGCVHV